MQVHLPTNQLGLDDEVGEVIVSCVDYVYVSTDGVGEQQDSIRGLRGSGEIAEDAVDRLRRLRGPDRSSPVLVCNTTVSKYNADSLEQMVPYAIQRGFDEIHFEYAGQHTEEHIDGSLIDGLRPTPYYVQRDGESILVDQEGARRLKRGLADIRRRFVNAPLGIKSINIDVLSEEDLHLGTVPNRKCYVERCEVTVDPAGNAVPCPFIHNYSMGSLVTEDFDPVWNSARHSRFRELQNSDRIEMCRHCILGAQRNPDVWTSLRRVFLTRFGDARYRLANVATAIRTTSSRFPVAKLDRGHDRRPDQGGGSRR